jgi:hypothetical protein
MNIEEKEQKNFLEIFLPNEVMKIIQIKDSVVDYYFTKKLKNFLFGLEDISENKRNKFFGKFKNQKSLERLGFKIINIINNSDDENKCILMGKLFSLYIKEEINIRFYFRICHLINNSYYEDLIELTQFTNENKILTGNSVANEEVLDSLFNDGFLNNEGIDGGNAKGENGGTIYSINEYGKVIRDIIKNN